MMISATILGLMFFGVPTAVGPEERVVCFPTYGYVSADGAGWTLNVHGWVYEDKNKSLMRNLTVRVFRRFLGVKKKTSESAVLKGRAMFFLADNERKTKIEVKIGDKVFPAGKTGGDGHFRTTVSLSRQDAAGLLAREKGGGISFTIIAHGDEMKKYGGVVRPVDPDGLFVISDIDDTMKVTNVLDHSETMENTFSREYKAVDGMPEVYRKLAKSGAEFHYVSAGPWQLYVPLSEFFKKAGYPEGFWVMKPFDWWNSTAVKIFSSPEKIKTPAIEQIMKDFPKRKFVFFGDNGEKDPEIYGEAARNHPGRVVHIYIRNVRGETPEKERYREAFKYLAPDSWSLYEKGADIRLPAGGK